MPELDLLGSQLWLPPLESAVGTVAIADPGVVYEGVPATVTVTGTGVDRVVLRIGVTTVWDDSSAPFDGPWTPGAGMGGTTVTLTADGYSGATLVASDTLEITVANPAVSIVSPAVETVFSTGVAGAISGTVSPPGTPVAIHNHVNGVKIGDATVVGGAFSFSWTSTVSDYGITSVDARTTTVTSDPLTVRVVTWPHTLFGSACINAWYGWVGVTLSTDVGFETKVTSQTSYGTEGKARAPNTTATSVDAATTAWFGGHQHLAQAGDGNSLRIRTTGAAAIAQTVCVIIHVELTSNPPGAGRTVFDGQGASNRVALQTSAGSSGVYWRGYAGTSADSAQSSLGEQTVALVVNGTHGRIDRAAAGATSFTQGAEQNFGTASMAGITTNHNTTYNAPASRQAFALQLNRDYTSDEATQLLRFVGAARSGCPFA